MDELPPGWSWATVTRRKQLRIRADQDAPPYRFTREYRADREDACARVAAEAHAEHAAQLAAAQYPAQPAPIVAGQLDMFDGLPASQLAERQYTACPTHGRFYQPDCWHCKRRRPDRPHRRASQG